VKQPKLMSFIESLINILVGFGISLGAQIVFLPMLGVTVTFGQNFVFACIMTVISIARSYLLRRLFEALHIRRPLSPFMQAVIAERFRQIEGEGWSAEHDDAHEHGELAAAGASYAGHAAVWIDDPEPWVQKLPPRGWPWTLDWWKPYGFRRDLVRGCALIIAEGEKFDRQRKRKPEAVSPASAEG
jgi:hypothetical protein